LKGKLDMLSAQLELRKSMQRAASASFDGADEPVIYVEGEEESSEDDIEEGMSDVIEESTHRKNKRSRSWEETGESSEDVAMPLINGVAHEEKESDTSDDEEEEDFIDDEAEEASEDETSEEDMVDEPPDEEVSDSEEEPSAPPKRSITTKLGFSRT
jgi:U3 small nucleolar RNA-associated protein 5